MLVCCWLVVALWAALASAWLLRKDYPLLLPERRPALLVFAWFTESVIWSFTDVGNAMISCFFVWLWLICLLLMVLYVVIKFSCGLYWRPDAVSAAFWIVTNDDLFHENCLRKFNRIKHVNPCVVTAWASMLACCWATAALCVICKRACACGLIKIGHCRCRRTTEYFCVSFGNWIGLIIYGWGHWLFFLEFISYAR